jgi:hypothetical protein
VPQGTKVALDGHQYKEKEVLSETGQGRRAPASYQQDRVLAEPEVAQVEGGVTG